MPACALALFAALLAAQAGPAIPASPSAPARPAGQPWSIEPLPPGPEAPSPEGPVLPLAEALQRARERTPDLALARERVVQSQLQVRRAWSAIQPTLTGNAAYTRNSDQFEQTFNTGQGSQTLVTQEKNALSASLVGQVTLFNGRAFPAIYSAYDLVEVSRLGETQLRRELLLQVASTYLSVLQLHQLAQAAFRQSQATRKQAAQALARYQAGLIQRSAVVRSRLDVVRADEEARRAVYSTRSAKSQLATLLDRHDTAFEVAQPPEAPPEVKGAFPELLQRSLDERPEMAAARLNEQISARLKTDAWAQFLPTLNLSAAARANNTGGTNTDWSVTLALSVPLYDGGFRYVALKDADSQRRTAQAQTHGAALRIEDELRRGLLDLEAARALREENEQALVLARENETLVRAQFEAGTATQIEVSDAEAALFQGEANVIRERLNVQLSALRLAKAVGAFDPL